MGSVSTSKKTVAVLSEWAGFSLYKNPEYNFLKEHQYKIYGTKPAVLSTGRLYWIGTKANPGGGITTGVCVFIDQENSHLFKGDLKYMLSKKELRELSAAAKETKCKDATLYTNYGLEVRSDENLKESIGFDKLVKIMAPFEDGGIIESKITQYSKFDNNLLNYWRNYGGSPASVWKNLKQLKNSSEISGGAIYPEYGFINYTKLIESLSKNDLNIITKIMVENNLPKLGGMREDGGIIGNPSMPEGGDFRFDIHSPLFDKGGKTDNQDVMSQAANYESEWNGPVKGFVSTWNKGEGEYEGYPVVYFAYEDDVFTPGHYKVANGIALPDGKLINTSDAGDFIYDNEEYALKVALSLAHDENYGVEDENFKSGGSLIAPGDKIIKIKPYSYHGWHYPKQIVWVDLSHKHPDPMRIMIWGYGIDNDTVSDFKRFFESAGPAVELTMSKKKYETYGQEKSRAIEMIRDYVDSWRQRKLAKGGEVNVSHASLHSLSKEERVTLMLALGFLSTYSGTFNQYQVGYTQTQQLIQDLSKNPSDHGNLNLAVLSLEEYEKDAQKWNGNKSSQNSRKALSKVITDLKAMADKYTPEPTKPEQMDDNVGDADVIKHSSVPKEEYQKLDAGTKNELYKNLVKSLSAEFARVIREWINPNDMAEVIRLNKTEEYTGSDATHDFVDSNMAMDEAFTKILGREYSFFDDNNIQSQKQNEWDTKLLNSAWSLAKKNDFDTTKILSAGLDTFESGGNLGRDRKFQSREDWEQRYKRKSSPKHPRYNTMAGGGRPGNGYKGKSGKEVWNNEWNHDQRKHFLTDHFQHNEAGDPVELANGNFYNLPVDVQIAVDIHTEIQGKYESGGELYKEPIIMTQFEYLRNNPKYNYDQSRLHKVKVYGEKKIKGDKTAYLVEKQPGSYGISVFSNKLNEEISFDSGTVAFSTLENAIKMFMSMTKQGTYKFQSGGELAGDNIDVFGYSTQYFVVSPEAAEAFKKAIAVINEDKDEQSAYYQARVEHIMELAKYVDRILSLEYLAIIEGNEITDQNLIDVVHYMTKAGIYNHKIGDLINLEELLGPHIKTISEFKSKPIDKTEKEQVPEMKKGGTIDTDTPIIPEIIADSVAKEILMIPDYKPTPEEIKNLPERLEKLSTQLVKKANSLYQTSPFFKKKITGRGNTGRDSLYAFMKNWAPALAKKNYQHGGSVAQSVTLDDYLDTIKLPRITSLEISKQEADYVAAKNALSQIPELEKVWAKSIVKSVDGFLSRSFHRDGMIDFVKKNITSKPAIWARLKQNKGLLLDPEAVPETYKDWLAKLLVSGIYGEFQLDNYAWNNYLPQNLKNEIADNSTQRGKAKFALLLHKSNFVNQHYELGGNLDMILGNPSYPHDFRFDIHGPLFEKGGQTEKSHFLTEANKESVIKNFLSLCKSYNYRGEQDFEPGMLVLEWGKYGYGVSESQQEDDYDKIVSAAKLFNEKYGSDVIAFPDYSDKYNTVIIADFKSISQDRRLYEQITSNKKIYSAIKKAGFKNAHVEEKLKRENAAKKAIESALSHIKQHSGVEILDYEASYFIKYTYPDSKDKRGFNLRFDDQEFGQEKKFTDAKELFDYLESDNFYNDFRNNGKNIAHAHVTFNTYSSEIKWYKNAGLTDNLQFGPFRETILTSSELKDALKSIIKKYKAAYEYFVKNKFESGGNISSEYGVAETIRDQIGKKALFMLGAYNLVKDTKKNSLSFRIRGSSKVNYIKIVLEGDDTYTVEFGKIRKPDALKAISMTPDQYMDAMYKKVNVVKQVYAEDLHEIIESNTGLYTRLFEKGGLLGEQGLLHSLLNTVSSGTISSFTGLKAYKMIDGIRTTAVQMLLRDGDQLYSVENLKKILREAVDEWRENEGEYEYQKRNREAGGKVPGHAKSDRTIKENKSLNLDSLFFHKLWWDDGKTSKRDAFYYMATSGDFIIDGNKLKYIGKIPGLTKGSYDLSNQEKDYFIAIQNNYKSQKNDFSEKVQLIDHNGKTIIYIPDNKGEKPYHVDESEFDSLSDAKKFIDKFKLSKKTSNRNKIFEAGGRLNLKDLLEKSAEKLIKHYLGDGTIPNEVSQQSELSEKGDYVIEKEHEGRYAGTFIEVAFGDKYKDADKALQKDYKSFAKFAEQIIGGKFSSDINIDIGTDDELQSVNFLVTKNTDLWKKSGRYEAGGSVKFNDKVKAIAKNLKGKSVPGKYKKDYGKKYSSSDAVKAARRITGAMNKKETKKG